MLEKIAKGCYPKSRTESTKRSELAEPLILRAMRPGGAPPARIPAGRGAAPLPLCRGAAVRLW